MTPRTFIRNAAIAVGAFVVLAAAVVIGRAWWDSRLPGSYNVMDYGTLDYGGGAEVPGGHHPARGVSVAQLSGPTGAPDERFTLTAERASVRLPSGRTIDALTFDGRLPGPELRVRQGDLVEVTLLNKDVGSGVSIHWHGVDVPNAEDGVAGVTQDAVRPGGRHVYRFRADQVGTFWYHTHQSSAKEVRRGLFGAFVIEPRQPQRPDALDLTLAAHTFGGIQTFGGSDELQRRPVPPGTPVRLRLVNTDNTPRRFTVDGTPFSVLAIDGTDLNGPTPLDHATLRIAAGGRFDVGFTMPPGPVRVSIPNTDAALVLGTGDVPPSEPGSDFDPLGYGRPGPTPFAARSRFDRSFRFEIGRKPGFFDGRPGMQWTINGGIYPDVPVFIVRRGDLVKVTISNTTSSVHPMHLHGHHMLVLSRDGAPSTGSPWWSDTLDVEPHEQYEVAFRADNPGLWMDHCHNLGHAADGLTMHLVYAGVATPFRAGGPGHNHPE